jgi:hypothetical protein
MDQFYTPFITTRSDETGTYTCFDSYSSQITEMKLKGQTKVMTLWEIRDIFEILNTAFSKFDNPSEHLVIDEVTVLFKGRVVFRKYISKKHKRFGIKI